MLLQRVVRRFPSAALLHRRASSALSSRSVGSASGSEVSSASPAALSGERARQRDVGFIPAPPTAPTQARATTMSVLPLGYAVGRFELEFVRGAPQLYHDVSDAAQLAAFDPHLLPSSEAAAAFDLSYVPPAAPDSTATLRSSWATDETATSSMEGKLKEQQRMEREQAFARQQADIVREHDEFIHPEGASASAAASQPRFQRPPVREDDPEATRWAASTVEEGESVSRSRSLPNARAVHGLSRPLEMHLLIDGSIILYQNFMFSWSPRTPSEVTAATLSFLRVLTPRPELVLLGTGAESSVHLAEDARQLLAQLHIGIEIMDTGNAIATYNILVDEGRNVLGALVQQAPHTPVARKLTRSEQMRQRLGYWQFKG